MTALYPHLTTECIITYFFETYNVIKPSAIGTVLSTISPGVSGKRCKTIVKINPQSTDINAALPGTDHPKTFDKTIGTKAAPNAVHAKITLSKIVSGAKSENNVAAMTTNIIASLALLIFLFLPSFQSLSTDVETVSNWLSAVDIIADKTAAEIMPAKIGPNNLSLTKNNTVSGFDTVEYITLAVNPKRIIPEKMMNAQNIAIYFPLLIVFISFAAINRFTTKGCPG